MSETALRDRYLGDNVATASPEKLVTMLYDRLTLDLERAQFALGQGDRALANTQLQHAQDIVLELRAGLRLDAWEGARDLAALYAWLTTELITANASGDAAKVAGCLQVVEPLRQAWHAAAAGADVVAG